jgi:hypothetical protein
MLRTTLLLLIAAALLFCRPTVAQQRPPEINSVLMESTFLIEGPSKEHPGLNTLGTVFLLSKPVTENAGTAVLVTAAHVLEGISGDTATLGLRKRLADGQFEVMTLTLQIRDKGVNKYIRHPTADVAVMKFPPGIKLTTPLVPTTWLIDDKQLVKFEIHPGDYLYCLGFPNGAAANEAMFPFLRTGAIASYPLIPSKRVKTFAYDVRVYPGNSGGPVYFHYTNRIYGGEQRAAETIMGVVGLVSQQVSSGRTKPPEAISVAVIVPAEFILDTIALLR